MVSRPKHPEHLRGLGCVFQVSPEKLHVLSSDGPEEEPNPPARDQNLFAVQDQTAVNK